MSDAIAFAERPLALTDLCLEHTSATGEPPSILTTRQFAGKVLELYWPHTVPFPSGSRPRVLRQNSGGQAEILTLIRASTATGNRMRRAAAEW